LLANYLVQLKNIRSLFSMGSQLKTERKTYFLNFLNNPDNPEGPNYVPDVNKLWRLFVDDSLAAVIGTPGSTLVFPVSRKSIDQLIKDDKLPITLPEDFAAFNY